MFNRELLDVTTVLINNIKRRLCCTPCVRCQPEDTLSEKSTLMSDALQGEGISITDKQGGDTEKKGVVIQNEDSNSRFYLIVYDVSAIINLLI